MVKKLRCFLHNLDIVICWVSTFHREGYVPGTVFELFTEVTNKTAFLLFKALKINICILILRIFSLCFLQ